MDDPFASAPRPSKVDPFAAAPRPSRGDPFASAPRPSKSSGVTLEPVQVLGTSEAERQRALTAAAGSGDIAAALELGTTQSNVPAMAEAQAAILKDRTQTAQVQSAAATALSHAGEVVLPALPGGNVLMQSPFVQGLADVAGANVVAPVMPDLASRATDLALDRAARAGVDVGSHATAFGVAGAGGDVAGNVTLGEVLPGARSLDGATSLREVGKRLAIGAAEQGASGYALGAGGSLLQGDDLRTANARGLEFGGQQAVLGTALHILDPHTLRQVGELLGGPWNRDLRTFLPSDVSNEAVTTSDASVARETEPPSVPQTSVLDDLRRRASDLLDPDGTRQALAVERERRVAAEREARTDPLTGIGNARALTEALPQAEADPNTAVISFDANGFGQVNKVGKVELPTGEVLTGNAAGDHALKDLSDTMRQESRGMGSPVQLYRRGGDEFVALVPKDHAQDFLARAQQGYGVRTYGDAQVSLTGSIGDTFAEADAPLQEQKAAAKYAQLRTPVDDLLAQAQSRAEPPPDVPSEAAPKAQQLAQPTAASPLPTLDEAGKGLPRVVGGAAGGLGGAAYGYATGKTPEERTKRAILYGIGGAAAGVMAGGAVEGAGVARGVDVPEASAQSAATGMSKILDDFRRVLAPTKRGVDAEMAGDIVRARAGEMAQRNERVTHALMSFARSFDRMPEGERLAFIDRMETGQPQPSPELSRAAEGLRYALDNTRKEIQDLGTGKLEHFIQDYFPHLWEDPSGAQSVIGRMLGKRPLEGSKSFLKQRTIPTVREGVEAGLTPVSTNPVDLALLKLREMQKYVMGQKVLGDLKSEGLLTFVRSGDRAPEGHTFLNDKVSTVLGPRQSPEAIAAGAVPGPTIVGHWYAPDAAAQVVNNYLSPGLGGNAVFDAYRQVGNLLNMAQLGLSAFHLGFTSLDASVSKAALGIEQALGGSLGAAMKSAAEVPIAPITNLLRGDKVLKEYLTPGTFPAFDRIVQGLVQGGGRVKMDAFYRNGSAEQFLKAFREGRYGEATARSIPAAIEAASKPILEYIVPRQKLGVFADLAHHALEQLGPDAQPADVRRAMADVWNSVDNRMGQLVYDNLFWNRAAKDLAMAATRSVGWNLGTFRELGGGAVDALKAGKDAAQGRPVTVTHKMAYVAALPVVVGLYGGIYHYLATGQAPQELKDYFYPKTGRQNPDGTEERVQLPSYLKDVRQYATSPWQTVKHKLNPALSTVYDMLENQDFYGNLIRNPDDPMVQQVGQELGYAANQFVPFGIRNAQQAKLSGQSGTTAALNFVGVTPAPRDIVRSDAQNRMHDILARQGVTQLTPEQVEQRDTRRALARKVQSATGQARLDAIQQGVRDATVTPAQAADMLRRSYQDPEALQFQRLTVQDALDVYKRATPAERKVWWPVLISKVDHADSRGDTAALAAVKAAQPWTLPRSSQ